MAFDVADQTDLLPGQRLIAGRPYTFDLDAYNAAVADRAIASAPADLSTLSDEDVSGLVMSWLNASRRRRGDAEVAAFGVRIHSERAKRPALVAAYGRVA